MDIKSLLDNDNVKSILSKVGVSPDKQAGVINQAYEVIQKKLNDNPQALSSLLSSKPNTEKDHALQAGMQSDLVNKLITKVGLSEDVAKKVSSSLPDLLKNIDMSAISSVISSFTGGKSGGDSIMSTITGLFSKFGKK